MWRALCALCFAAACTTNDPSATSDPAARATAPQQEIGAASHVGVKMTPAIRGCRDACWRDIPFDECAHQRDACLGDAKTDADQRHCRHVAHTCRKIRRDCLQGCWKGIDPRPALEDPSQDGS